MDDSVLLVSTDLALSHVRQDAGVEDAWIAMNLAAAQQSALDYLNRQVFADDASMEAAIAADTAGDFPMVVNAAIQAAILRTFGELYKNREDSTVGARMVELPFTSRDLLRPHRIIPGI